MQIQAMISLSLGTLLPALTAMYAQKDWERLRASYLRGCRYILWLTMLVSCPVFVYAPELIRLFVGDLYQGAAPVMRMRLLLLPLMQTIGLLSPLTNATAQLREFCLATFVSQVIRLGVAIYLVKVLKMGAFGAALSMLLVVGFAIALVFWPLGLRMAHVTFGQFAREVLARGLLPMAVAVGGGFLVRGMVLPSSWLGLAAQGLFCCLLYIITLGLFCLDRNERGLGLRFWKWLGVTPALGPRP